MGWGTWVQGRRVEMEIGEGCGYWSWQGLSYEYGMAADVGWRRVIGERR